MNPAEVKPERARIECRAPERQVLDVSAPVALTFTDIIREARLDELQAETKLPDVAVRLAALAKLVAPADAATRALVREEALRAVERTGARAAAKLVDAHLDAKAVADAAQGSPVLFAAPNPWPSPVTTAEVLAELETAITGHVVLPPGAALALALWVLHTHALDAAQITPRLAIVSPVKRCGKSTLLKLLGALVRRPLPTANTTAAAVFRVIEAHEPTLLVDEADTFLAEREELRGVLNAGHDRQTASVVRCVGEDAEPRSFRVWTPVAVAAIGKLPDTLMDRSVIVTMARKTATDRVRRFRRGEREALTPLRRRCERWARDAAEALSDAAPSLPDALDDRAQDNWEALLAIADAAGEPWATRARNAARVLSGERADEEAATLGEALLVDVRAVFETRDVDRLSTKMLLDDLAKLDGRPWAEASKGRPLTSNHLGRLLGRFGIRSRSTRLADNSTPKGYHRDDFMDAWRRYLPQGAATAATERESLAKGSRGEAPRAPPVAAPISPNTASVSRDVASVAAPNGAARADHEHEDLFEQKEIIP